MSSVAAVLRKELAGRRTILIAALALGCVPFLLPLLPGARGQAPEELREAALWAIAALGSGLLAIVLGADLLSRELAERRMGFYFSRPISTSGLWIGKLLAAYLVLLAGSALLILPVMTVDWRHLTLGRDAAWIAAGTPLALLVLLLVASAGTILVRARSAWLALDGLAVAIAATIAATIARRLFVEGAGNAMVVGLSVFGAVVLFALFAAHQAALESGRTDLRAVRRTLARRLWGLLLPAAVSFALFGAWVLSASPRQLAGVWALQPAPSGPWMVVGGPLRGRFGFAGLFLWRPEDNRYTRVHAYYTQTGAGPIAFSADGKMAAWLGRDGASYTVWTLDLSAGGRDPVRTTSSYASIPRVISLSPTGRNIAANVSDRWILEDLAAGKILASVTAPEFVTSVRWQAEDRVRIFALSDLDEPVVSAVVWDLAPGGRMATPALRKELHALPRLKASPDGSRALIHDASGWSLFEVSTGAELARFSIRNAAPDLGIPSRQPIFLPDGGLASTRDESGRRHLAHFDVDGNLLRDYDLGPAHRVWPGGMPDPHTMLLSLVDSTNGDFDGPFASRLVSLDFDSGEVTELGRNAGPFWYGESWTDTPKGDAARWFAGPAGQVLYLDPKAGLVPRLGPPKL